MSNPDVTIFFRDTSKWKSDSKESESESESESELIPYCKRFERKTIADNIYYY